MLVMLTVCAALCTFTVCAGKAIGPGGLSWPGVAAELPVPLVPIVCGLPTPLLVTVTLPLRAPPADGLKLIVTSQVVGFLVPMQPLAATVNSEALAPLTTKGVVNVTCPPLISTAMPCCVDVPTSMEPVLSELPVLMVPGAPARP